MERAERAEQRRAKARAQAEEALAAQRDRLDPLGAERQSWEGLAPRPRSRAVAGTASTPAFPPGDRALTLAGNLELGATNNISKDGEPWLWNDTSGNMGAGLNAMVSTTSGTSNTAVGYYALYSNAGGSANTAFGAYALQANVDGETNSAFGSDALSNNTSGNFNSAFGHYALRYNTTGFGNAAVGATALFNNDGAYPYGSNNTAVGAASLSSNTTGFFNVAVGAGALFYNTDGSLLTAVGHNALHKNQTVGMERGVGNTAVGNSSLKNNTIGSFNTATGNSALYSNEEGSHNTAIGWEALKDNTDSANSALGSFALANNTTGYGNTAVGTRSLYANQGGYGNTAVGYYALYSSNGYANIAVGANAGNSTPPIGSYNILIGHTGVGSDQGVIRLGTPGTQALAYVAGIYGTPGPGAAYVHVTPLGQLVQGGPVPPSSRRFKLEIRDMGEASDRLAELRPVSFRFKEEHARGRTGTHYGLIAEEVAAVFPQVVEYDEGGKPYTVRYQLLVPLLLNELQEQRRLVRGQGEEIARLRDELGATATSPRGP